MVEPILLKTPLNEKTARSLHAGQRVLIASEQGIAGQTGRGDYLFCGADASSAGEG